MENERQDPMVKPLTRRQQEIYEYLEARQDREQPAPTLDELCRAMGVRSRGSLHKHVRALIGAGLVAPMNRRQRGVRVTPPPDSEVPFLGYVAGGRPIEAIPVPESIECRDYYSQMGTGIIGN